MFNTKYLTMHNVQMHAGAISKLLYSFASVRALTQSLKLLDYFPVQTHKPYNSLHVIVKPILQMYNNLPNFKNGKFIYTTKRNSQRKVHLQFGGQIEPAVLCTRSVYTWLVNATISDKKCHHLRQIIDQPTDRCRYSPCAHPESVVRGGGSIRGSKFWKRFFFLFVINLFYLMIPSKQSGGTIDPPSKRHLNGVLLAGR